MELGVPGWNWLPWVGFREVEWELGCQRKSGGRSQVPGCPWVVFWSIHDLDLRTLDGI